jgi:hypothetical protein
VFQGQRQRALQLYSRYLAEEKDPRQRARVEKRVAELLKTPAVEPTPDKPAPPPPATATPAPATPATAAPATPATAAPATAAPPTATPALVATPPATPPPRKSRRWVWGVAGAAAAVAIGAAITLGVVFGSSQSDPTPTLGRGHLQ